MNATKVANIGLGFLAMAIVAAAVATMRPHPVPAGGDPIQTDPDSPAELQGQALMNTADKIIAERGGQPGLMSHRIDIACGEWSKSGIRYAFTLTPDGDFRYMRADDPHADMARRCLR